MYVKNALTFADAKQIAAAAEAEALKNNWRVTIAVLDDGGNLLFCSGLTRRRLAPLSSPRKRRAPRFVQTADESLRGDYRERPHGDAHFAWRDAD